MRRRPYKNANSRSYQPLSEKVPEATGKHTKFSIMIADPEYKLNDLPLG